MVSALGAFAGVLALAVFVQWFTEWTLGSVLSGKLVKFGAAVAAVALCCLLEIGILHTLGVEFRDTSWAVWVDRVVTGCMVGGGSNVLNNFIKTRFPDSTPQQPPQA